MDDPIEWPIIREDRFNSVVEALLVRAFTDTERGLRAVAIDGRGGDGGIDVGVWDSAGNIVRIFQLKHFLDGWPARVKGRRDQIAGSFDKAWKKHHPPKWTLVTPRNPSMNERQFVIELGRGKSVQVDTFGPAELDALLGEHPEVLERFGVDRGRQLLRDVGREEWALNRSSDLAAVIAQVHRQLRKRSDHWASLITVDEYGNLTEEIRPLTSNASEREPLELNVATQFSEDTEELRQAFEDALRHGLVEPVTLDSAVLRRVTFVGPDWFQSEHDGGELTLLPAGEGAGLPASITLRDAHGKRVSQLPATVKMIARGTESARLVLESPGGLETRWTLPEGMQDAGSIAFATDFAGHRLRDIRRLLRFFALAEAGCQLLLEVNERSVALALQSSTSMHADTRFEEFLDDLIFIEDELDVEFRLPADDLSVDERIWARVLVRILQGNAVHYPGIDGFNFTLTGDRGTVEDYLETEQGAFLIQHEDYGVTILNTNVYIGHVFIYQGYGQFVDGLSHAAALKAGAGAGRQVQVRAVDNLPFVIYAPERLKGGKVVIAGLGIDGLPEHPKLDELRRRQRARDQKMPGPEAQRRS
jgi:hypothetical protein